MATRIQKHIRGYLDRIVFRKKKYKRWYEFVYIPAIIKIQSIVRQKIAERDFRELIRQHKYARIIQRIWQTYLLRGEAAKVLLLLLL